MNKGSVMQNQGLKGTNAPVNENPLADEVKGESLLKEEHIRFFAGGGWTGVDSFGGGTDAGAGFGAAPYTDVRQAMGGWEPHPRTDKKFDAPGTE